MASARNACCWPRGWFARGCSWFRSSFRHEQVALVARQWCRHPLGPGHRRQGDQHSHHRPTRLSPTVGQLHCSRTDFRGIKLSNKTHRSTVDPDALLCRKSNAHPALLSYRGHVFMDNRHALIVDCKVTQATGTGERDAAMAMAADVSGAHKKTIGAHKNDDTRGFVAEMRRIGITPHVAQNTSRSGGFAIDGRTTLHEGYAKSINARRGIEKVFGWIKQWGGLRQFKVRGTEKVSAVFGLHVVAYNLIRLGNLLKPAMAAA
jgi:hypothetical protein